MNVIRWRKGTACRLPFLRLLIVAAALAVAGATINGAPRSEASGESMLAIDVKPGANSPASVGKIETCASYDAGDQFEVDVVVNNVNSLRTWELRVEYDEDVVAITSADYNYFLVSAPPGGGVFPSLFEKDSPGIHFMAASEFQAGADSGSGILARLTMEALDDGTSPIRIVESPKVKGPRLSDGRGGDSIGDSNGDGIWDDTVTDAEVRVGRNCRGDAPVITPIPSPKPGTATPRPNTSGGATPQPGADPGDSDDDPSDDGVVAVPGGDQNDSDEPGTVGGVDDGDGDNDGGGSGDDGAVADGDGDGNGDDPASDGADGSGNDLPSVRGFREGANSTTWLLIIGGVAVGLVAAGGGLYALSKRERL